MSAAPRSTPPPDDAPGRLPTWLVVDLPGGELAAEVLGETLMELGAKGMTPVGDRLQTSFASSVDKDAVLGRIRAAVESLHGDGLLPDARVEARIVEDEDWVGRWVRSLGPIRAGERFLIVPPGVQAEPHPRDIILAIEPRMAFGTGEHATTQLALAAMEPLPLAGARVLDLGCGNGVLAVAALLAGAAEVLAVDFEEESVIETADNARRHGVDARLTVRQADVLDWTPEHPAFDILLANIYITPILAGIGRWADWLRPGGHVVFTGVKEERESQELLAAMRRVGLTVSGTSARDSWFCARGSKEGYRSPVRLSS